MFTRVLLIMCLVPGSFHVFSETKEITPEEIIKKADEYRSPDKPFEFTLKLFFIKENEVQSENRFIVNVNNKEKDVYKSLIKFIYPNNIKGRVMLMDDTNMWIYIPNTRNPIRISPSQRLSGDASNGDIASINYIGF